MQTIVFATNNAHKVEEVKAILGTDFEIKTLREIDCFDELPETSDTLEGNALQKARYVHQKFGVNCVADDTGLEVEALNGAPGVYSARYAGEDCIAENNMNKLLQAMNGVTNRKARFRTVAALILDNKEFVFDGVVNGEILSEKHGLEGFGYDPVFRPDGFAESFAQMAAETKNSISHRGRAFSAFAEFMKTQI